MRTHHYAFMYLMNFWLLSWSLDWSAVFEIVQLLLFHIITSLKSIIIDYNEVLLCFLIFQHCDYITTYNYMIGSSHFLCNYYDIFTYYYVQGCLVLHSYYIIFEHQLLHFITPLLLRIIMLRIITVPQQQWYWNCGNLCLLSKFPQFSSWTKTKEYSESASAWKKVCANLHEIS